MRSGAALAVGVLPALAFAGAADYQKLPPCARAPVLRAIGYSDCVIGDTNCICQTNDLFIQLKDVVPHACQGDDFKKAYEKAYEICPNLKDKLPPENNPDLRTHPNALAPPAGNYDGPNQRSALETHRNPYVEDPLAEGVKGPAPDAGTKASLDGPTPPPPTAPGKTTQAPGAVAAQQTSGDDDEGSDELGAEAPEPYSTPADFAASVTATLEANDFGNTETWRYPTGAPTVTSKPSGSGSGGIEQATGKAASFSGGSGAKAGAVAALIAFIFLFM